MGVSINGGNPPNGWFIVAILLKWMIYGYPHFRKPPYDNHRIWGVTYFETDAFGAI